MNEKTITQKLYKNPAVFLYSETFFPYVLNLEETGELQKLPGNLYVYYVLSILEGEVNNGGFIQYLTNPGKDTFKELAECAKRLNDPALTPLLIEFVDLVSKYLTDNIFDLDNAEYDDEFCELLNIFDDRFYEIDKKSDIHKLILRYYKNNYTVNSIKYKAIIEKESKDCRYFILPEECVCNEIEEAIDNFLKILSDFSELKWRIEIYRLFDDYSIIAHAFGAAIDLDIIMKKWDDRTFSFCGNEKDCYTNRMKACSYFNKIRIRRTEGHSEYAVVISPSVFAAKKMKMKRKLLWIGSHFGDKATSAIETVNMSYKSDPDKYERIKNHLEKHYMEYSNIETVFENAFL